jgi:threonine synthase
VETSGDTGPAAVAAVKSCPHVEIYCLYPSGRVSPVQELQLVTVDSPNVHVYKSECNTDEQADLLKEIFMDVAWVKRHNVCSINSINWGRITAQSSYYIWSYLQLRPAVDGLVNFIVPTGAFGNALGGFVAKQMGVPIGTIVCATNANDAVHRCLSRGDLSIGTNLETLSPAMDIQFAYNLERLLYYVCNQNCEVVAKYMTEFEANRGVRFAFFDRILHSRMLLDPTHVRFNHACALEANMRVTNSIPLNCLSPLPP